MLDSHKLLRAFITEQLQQLTEDALPAASAAAAGLALMTPPNGLGAYVLYDQDKFVTTMLGMVDESSRKEIAKQLLAAGVVIASLYVDKTAHCWEARTVSTVAAQHGYGPLLYDVAMSDGPLAPMRDAVSLSAERVWRHYYEKRSDVVHEPLQNCKKHVSVRPWLNFKYTMTSDMSSTFGALRKRHTAAIKELEYDFPSAVIRATLEAAADMYFDARYIAP